MANKPEVEAKSRLALDRRTRIVELAAHNGFVRVPELSEIFGVSEVTIRNDLDLLSKQGLLVRDRGGALANTHSSLFVAFAQRANLNLDEKRRIGKAAARLVKSGDTIIMDAGTTVIQMAKSLSNDLAITAVTNALNVAMEVGTLPDAHVILLGGSLIRETVSTVGPQAERDLHNVIAQKAFMSAHSIDPEWGPADTSIEVAHVKRVMAQVAREVILLADSSKWGSVAFARTVPWSGINIMITDSNMPEEAQTTIKGFGIKLIVV